ncbi:MAG: hypothetical protein GF317_22165 [Candidatus Lokiarchaeota archaeon]|nr:hypothetical protein [Candidatus Lokiarchaeota archaeon]MBD3202166.1 hypothetical protein [Candidatus Lokiarchaeota archaeon]
MFLLFHVALPLLIFEIPNVKQNFSVNRLALIIGAIISDFIDKPLMFLRWGSGRGISHSLLFALISTLILLLITQEYKNSEKYGYITISYLIGIIFHIVLDLPEVPLFYPFISYDYLYQDNIIEVWLINLFTVPLNLLTEIFGLSVLVFIIIYNKLYSIKAIFKYITNT